MLLVETRPCSAWHLSTEVSCHFFHYGYAEIGYEVLRFHFCGFIRNYPGFKLIFGVGSKKNDACTEYCHLQSKNRLSFRFGLAPLIDHFHLNTWLEIRKFGIKPSN